MNFRPDWDSIEDYDVNKLPFFDIESLANKVGMSSDAVLDIAANSDILYKTFYINKDTGKICKYSEGLRLRRIDAPVAELKTIQAAIAELLRLLPFNECNYGFIEGKSILDAAKSLSKGDVLIHADVKDFFPEHSAAEVRMKLRELFAINFPGVFTANTISVLTKLLCLNNRLPQGSPASPILTVVLNKDMDERVVELANKYGMTCSRYVDDLGFAGNASNLECAHLIDDLSEVVHPLRLNRKKCGIMRTSSKPVCRGLTISTPQFMMTSMQVAVKELCAKYVTIDRITTSPHVIEIETRMDSADALTEAAATIEAALHKKYHSFKFTVKRRFFYVQSVKTMLGLHVNEGKVNYPRKQFNELRLTAMLIGIQRALFYMYHIAQDIADNDLAMTVELTAYKGTDGKGSRNMLRHPLNRKTYNGKKAYVRSVDPVKGAALETIETKAFKKMLNRLYTTYLGRNKINIHSMIRRYL